MLVPPSPSIPLLKGLRVLELANVLAGPATGMFCAELGAEVLKLEHPQGGIPPAAGPSRKNSPGAV